MSLVTLEGQPHACLLHVTAHTMGHTGHMGSGADGGSSPVDLRSFPLRNVAPSLSTCSAIPNAVGSWRLP